MQLLFHENKKNLQIRLNKSEDLAEIFCLDKK